MRFHVDKDCKFPFHGNKKHPLGFRGLGFSRISRLWSSRHGAGWGSLFLDFGCCFLRFSQLKVSTRRFGVPRLHVPRPWALISPQAQDKLTLTGNPK